MDVGALSAGWPIRRLTDLGIYYVLITDVVVLEPGSYSRGLLYLAVCQKSLKQG